MFKFKQSLVVILLAHWLSILLQVGLAVCLVKSVLGLVELESLTLDTLLTLSDAAPGGETDEHEHGDDAEGQGDGLEGTTVGA